MFISSRSGCRRNNGNNRCHSRSLVVDSFNESSFVEKYISTDDITNFLLELYTKLSVNEKKSERKSKTTETIVGSDNHCSSGTDSSKEAARDIFREFTGFDLEPINSPMKGAGKGLFLRGTCTVGTVVAIYPGVVYSPGMPLLFQSFRNHYILRRTDGFTIDGKYFGLSRYMFNSMASKTNPYKNAYVDTSWLQCLYQMKNNNIFDHHTNRCPLNLGQIINHGLESGSQNVTYYQYTLPHHFPSSLRSFLPNVYYHDHDQGESESGDFLMGGIKTVVLITTRDVKDEELLANYNHVGP